MGVVEHEVTMISPRQQEAALHLLQSAEKPNAAPRCLFPNPTGDILREHGPSLGKTPDPIGEFGPVILTSPRTSQRERTFD
jgi:hypothetical protein